MQIEDLNNKIWLISLAVFLLTVSSIVFFSTGVRGETETSSVGLIKVVEANGTVEDVEGEPREDVEVVLNESGKDDDCGLITTDTVTQTDGSGFWKFEDLDVHIYGDYCYLDLEMDDGDDFQEDYRVKLSDDDDLVPNCDVWWNEDDGGYDSTCIWESNFEVEINHEDSDSEVIEGEELDIYSTIENTGSIGDKQKVVLRHDHDEKDYVTVNLDGVDVDGEHTYEGKLTWGTEIGDAGDYVLEVASNDDEDQINTEVGLSDYTLQINIDGEGEELSHGEGTHTFKRTETVTLEASPDPDWVFVEWLGYEESEEEIVSFDMPSENVEMTAVFEREDRVLTVDSTEGGEVLQPGEGTFEYKHGDVVDLEAVEDQGYHFVEWTGDVGNIEDTSSPSTEITMEDDYSITAEFAAEEYELTVNVEGEGEELNYGEGTHTFEYGETVELEASSDDGWYFAEWTGYVDSDDKVVSFDMPAEDMEMTAVFEREDRVLTVDSTEGGNVVQPGEGTFEYKHGDVVDLEAVEDQGYHFVEWTGDTENIEDPGSAVTTVTMEDDYSITAEFAAEEYELTVNVEGEGEELNYGEGTHTINYGENVLIEASPDEGWYFAEWTGYIDSTEEVVSFTMPAEDAEVTAWFGSYGVEVEAPADDEVIEAGEYKYNFTVKNTGDMEDTYNITISEEGSWLVDTSEIILASGEKKNVTATLKIPGEDITEENTVTLTATSQNDNTVWDSDSFTVYFKEHYEVEVVAPEDKVESEPGNYTYNFTVRNEGNREDTYSLSVDDTEEWSPRVTDSVTIGPWENKTLGVNLTVPDAKGITNMINLTATSDNASDWDTFNVTHEAIIYSLELLETIGNGTVYLNGEEIETPDEEKFEEGMVIELNSTPDEDWDFSHWMGDYPGGGQLNDTINITMDENKTLRAYFQDVNETIDHSLTLNSTGGGEVVEPGEGTFPYNHGELVPLEASPKDCWLFSEWIGDIMDHYHGNETEVTVLMNENKIITANFTESPECYTLTIQTEGQGTTDPEPGEYRILATEDVEIEAIPDSGWYFSEWTGDYEGTDSVITVTMDSDKVITANFYEEVDPRGHAGDAYHHQRLYSDPKQMQAKTLKATYPKIQTSQERATLRKEA